MPETIKNARQLRNNMTDVGRKLWRHLRGRQIFGCKFRRQAPIGKHIADFVCFGQKLVIELDSGHHKDRSEYDRKRSSWLQTQGFRVVRFWNSDVLKNIDGVLKRIGGLVDNEFPPPPPPRPSPIKGEGD